MEKLQVYRSSSVDWKPSAVVALAASPDGSQVAAAREDGSLEIWLVSPGSIRWNCQLTIHGESRSRVSSLIWCRPNGGAARLLSSSIDGSISEWDVFSLKQKVLLDSIGVSIWQIAAEPIDNSVQSKKEGSQVISNGYTNYDAHSDSESEQTDIDDDSEEIHAVTPTSESQRLAVACDDGCLRIYDISGKEGFNYSRSFPRVSGRLLSVIWSLNARLIFSGSSNGFIRCWDATSFHEVYRITVGVGGLGTGPELCIWSLLFLRCGTLVSGDSTGSVQFWDSHYGTLLQVHTYHKGDVNALATVPTDSRVFSGGSDGQVILYKLSTETFNSGNDELRGEPKWVHIGGVRAHSHDVRALAVAVPVSSEGFLLLVSPAYVLPYGNIPKIRQKNNPMNSTYRKWARLGVPMLISAGDDTKLFTYSARKFTQFSPHDICPAPQLLSVYLGSHVDGDKNGAKVMLVQNSSCLDFLLIRSDGSMAQNTPFRRHATTQHILQIKKSRKIICSAISDDGLLSACSDHVKPSMFELRGHNAGKNGWFATKVKLPNGLPYAHCMIFSSDSSHLILSGNNGKIYVVDVKKAELLHTFAPRRKEDMKSSPCEPPIIRMLASSDGRWLAAINCYGDIYIFNMEKQRSHWFISRLNGGFVTAGGFPPTDSNVLVITTSLNQAFVFDVEEKQLGEWSRFHTFSLPRRFLEYPGEVIGLSFPPSSKFTSVIVYSSRAMCLIDFEAPIDQDDDALTTDSDQASEQRNSIKNEKCNRKRRNSCQESRPNNQNNSNVHAFRDPVLFVRHLSESSVLVKENKWIDVVQRFEAPIHRHLFGT